MSTDPRAAREALIAALEKIADLPQGQAYTARDIATAALLSLPVPESPREHIPGCTCIIVNGEYRSTVGGGCSIHQSPRKPDWQPIETADREATVLGGRHHDACRGRRGAARPDGGKEVTEKNKKILLMDRSGGELDDQCGMAFFWNRVWHPPGRPEVAGIVPEREAIYYSIGREIHEDLAMVAEMPAEELTVPGIEARVKPLLQDLTDEDKLDIEMMEILTRRIGWLAAYALFMEPAVREKYDTVYCEDEIILDREPLWVPVTPDRVLRERSTGKLHYREYKSTANAGSKWSNSWPFAIQLHLGLKALQEELGEPLEYGQIMGLYKGYDSKVTGLTHPYVWAWRNLKNGTWTHQYEKATPRADWERAPVWEYPAGIVQWVHQLGLDTARQQFPFSPPVGLNEAMVEGWVTRKKHRARVVDNIGETCIYDEKMRECYFEQRTSKCRPAFGDQCAYLSLCWNASMQDDPLSKGFVPRVPHHEVEIIWREQEKQEVKVNAATGAEPEKDGQK